MQFYSKESYLSRIFKQFKTSPMSFVGRVVLYEMFYTSFVNYFECFGLYFTYNDQIGKI
jgi:hypothetical protein